MAKESDSIKILTYDDIHNPLQKYLEQDGQPGLPVCFQTFGKLYSHKAGGVTDWTGFPASGKTYFALEVLMGLSEKFGQRHGLYVPDIGSYNEIIQKLVKMKTGKDFHKKYDNKITASELSSCLNWLLHHFVIFKKKDFKTGITPIAFWEKVAEYKDDGGKLNTGLADSWKNFKHIYNNREDSYLDEMLSIRNEMSEDYQVHYHTIAHAVKTELAGALGKNDKGKRRIPTAWDIKGGGSWNANGKNIITIDRPDLHQSWVDVYVNKVKPEDVGIIGSVQNRIKLDVNKGRYYEIIAGQNLFSYGYETLPKQADMDFFSTEVPPPVDIFGDELFKSDEQEAPF